MTFSKILLEVSLKRQIQGKKMNPVMFYLASPKCKTLNNNKKKASEILYTETIITFAKDVIAN